MVRILGTMAICAAMSLCAGPRSHGPSDQSAAQLIESLRRTLEDPELIERDPDRLAKAIRRAGSLRLVETIPDLINLLGFRYKFRWEREGGPQVIRPTSTSRYPAAEALIEIGKPALPALVDVVATHDFNTIQSERARYAIREIFRYEPSNAKEFLKDAAAKASTSEAKQRLLKALQTADEDRKSD